MQSRLKRLKLGIYLIIWLQIVGVAPLKTLPNYSGYSDTAVHLNFITANVRLITCVPGKGSFFKDHINSGQVNLFFEVSRWLLPRKFTSSSAAGERSGPGALQSITKEPDQSCVLQKNEIWSLKSNSSLSLVGLKTTSACSSYQGIYDYSLAFKSWWKKWRSLALLAFANLYLLSCVFILPRQRKKGNK